MTNLEAHFTPADFAALQQRDLTDAVCVVFDVLRATSTMITALANGADAIVPVEEIPEALAERARDPQILLAGERDGLRIGADRTGSIAFDLGNSPREFTPDQVRGRTIVITTTNGTRALRACAQAQTVYVCSFLNLKRTANEILTRKPKTLHLVCSGTFEQAALEDTLGAGALAEIVWPLYAEGRVADSALMALRLFTLQKRDLTAVVAQARNGSRLLSRPDLRDDVAFCLQPDRYPLLAALEKDGRVRKQGYRRPDSGGGTG